MTMMKLKWSNETAGMVLATLGIFLFSAKAILVKVAYRYEVDAVSLLLLRMMFSMPVYLVIAAWHYRRPRPAQIYRRDYVSIVFLGFVGYYLASYFDFLGLKYISASLERLILFAYPTIVILISAIVFRKKIMSNQWLAIIITYLGIMVTFMPDIGSDTAGGFWWGSALIFMSAFTYAMFIAGSGNLIPRFGSVYFTALTMTVSCVCVIAHHVVTSGFVWEQLPTEIYIIAFCMAVFSTIIPSFLVSEAIKKMGSSNFAIVGSLGPVSTIILAVIFIQEVITVYQLIGTAIVIGGISVLKMKKELSWKRTWAWIKK